MADIACINGLFMTLADAVVPIEDRGYQFADGVYEVIVAHGGKPFLLDDHLKRLQRSADGIGLNLDCSTLGLRETIQSGIARCGYEDVMIYLQITRGVASREHAYGGEMTPNVVLTFKRKPIYDPQLRADGIDLVTVADTRWAHCSIKSIALLANIMIKNAAKQRGFFDAIIKTPADEILETSCANVFIVRGGKLLTPVADTRILHGITRGHLLNVAREEQIPCEECSISVGEMFSADEVFITSSSIDILPVRRVDNQTIGDGKPGPMGQRLLASFPKSAIHANA
jgi:D-alanine transaminase